VNLHDLQEQQTLDSASRPLEAERKGVQSIEVGGELLKALSRHDEPLLLKDVARHAGMSAAKAHPYLVSFCKTKLVEQDQLSGRYRLGALALKLGLAALAQSTLVQRAIHAVSGLKERTRHTTAIAVWSRQGPTVVHLDAIDFPLDTNLRVGSVMSLLSTATGRVFAGFLPVSMTKDALESELARARFVHERDELRARFEEEVQQTRTRGMARALGQPLPGVNALSAPVFERGNSLAMAITLLGPEKTFDAKWTGVLAKELQQCCRSLCRD
jgi:DNA-binding IclR family transcriptional regulator